VCRAFLKISYRAEEIYPAKIKVYLSIYLSINTPSLWWWRRSNLTIIGTQPSDAGDYRCEAMNEPGIDMDQATLTVHGEMDTTSVGMCTM